MTRIAVLVSGGGTNLQALIDAWKMEKLSGGQISLVISSVSEVYALERARIASIKAITIERNKYEKFYDFDTALEKALCEEKIDLVVLAGFLSIIGEKVLNTFNNRIINVHPSLIPSFCGKGYYGLRVHQAALDYGVKITGATVHFVNNVIDGGKIILQKAVNIESGDTAEILQERVMREAEWELLPKAVSMFCAGEIL